jgi:hypothetical protein
MINIGLFEATFSSEEGYIESMLICTKTFVTIF